METITNTNNIIDTKIIHLSSRGDSGNILNGDYKSVIQYNIPDAITNDDTIDYILWSIPFCIIPNSFYIINETNNKLVITINSITTDYYFEYGNYSANLFIKQFNLIIPSTFIITLDSLNSKFTITNTTYDFIIENSTIDYIIGFTGSISSIDKSITFSRCCNFLPLPRVNICCSQLSNFTLMASKNDISNIILSVPNNGKLNGQIIYNNVSQIKKLFKNDRLDNFIISLTNDDGEPINFNGISFYMSLQFDICRKQIIKPLNFKKIVNLINNKILEENENNI